MYRKVYSSLLFWRFLKWNLLEENLSSQISLYHYIAVMNAAATNIIDSFLLPASSKFDFHCVQGHNRARIDLLRSPVVHTQPQYQIKVKNDSGGTTENI